MIVLMERHAFFEAITKHLADRVACQGLAPARVVKVNDLSQFNQLQQALTESGFTDLTASFSVSNQREIETCLLEKALARAQEKATQLAKASGRSLKRVTRVTDIGENEGLYGYQDINRHNPSQNVVTYENDAFRQMASVP